MAGEKLARFMELRGKPVVDFGGSLFYRATAGIYMSLPYERMLEWPADQASSYLKSHRLAGIRFPSRTLGGLDSGLYVRRRPYSYDLMHRNARAKVREATPLFSVRHVDEEDLLREGILLNQETMRRQNRWDPEFCDPRKWERFVSALAACPWMEAVGAYSEDGLQALAILCREDRWVHILHKTSRIQPDGSSPNYILDFLITRESLNDPSIDVVCMGYISLLEIQGLHDYKTRLGFKVEPCRCVIRFHPALSPILINSAASASVEFLRSLRPRSQFLQLTGAVLRAAEFSAHNRAVEAQVPELTGSSMRR